MTKEVDVHYELFTACGCYGSGFIGRNNFAWLGGEEPTDETTSATFRLAVGSSMGDEYEIDGDDWRDIEDQGQLEEILKYVTAGHTIEEAVNAAIEAIDPDGYDASAMDKIDAMQARIERLEALLERTSLFVAKHNLLLAREIDKVLKEGL